VYLLAVVYMLSAFALIIFSLICINGVDDTTPPIGERSIVMSVSVCLCVCLSTIISSELHVRPSPTFFLHVTCGRGSVLLWRRGDTLCTSGFMDDVMFAYKPRLLDVAAHAALGLAVNCAQ